MNKGTVRVTELSLSEYKVARFYLSNCYITSGNTYIIPISLQCIFCPLDSGADETGIKRCLNFPVKLFPQTI